ncbi:hypothetical protein K3495_g9371 [Podosphaera aphanis]|nr:hypothetical protein K3495_g9371 [Podosphaera aphanis]
MDSTIDPTSDQREIRVLVTGFGAFLADQPQNPALEIVRKLPQTLPATQIGETSIPPVQIVITPDPIKVAYRAVRDLIPSLWDRKRADMAIHIGLAQDRDYYSIERLAHRDGYRMADVDGFMCPDSRGHMAADPNWVWYGLPEELKSDLDIDDVWKRWKTSLMSADLRVSDDPGRYLCDFIYYSSLAYLAQSSRKKLVTFLHVPPHADETAISFGTEVTIKLIQAMVQSEIVKRKG